MCHFSYMKPKTSVVQKYSHSKIKWKLGNSKLRTEKLRADTPFDRLQKVKKYRLDFDVEAHVYLILWKNSTLKTSGKSMGGIWKLL